MIAITKQQLPTIEELIELLKKRLETLGKVEELETRALESVALVISAYRQVDLSVDFYEGFVNRMLEMFPLEIRQDYDDLDAEKTTISLEAGEKISELEERIAELEADIDNLTAVNKKLTAHNSDDINAGLTNSRLANFRIKISELEERIAELEADIDNLTAVNKKLTAHNSDLEIDRDAALAGRAEIEKVLITRQGGNTEDRTIELENRIKELEAILSRNRTDSLWEKEEENSTQQFNIGDRVQFSPFPDSPFAGQTGAVVAAGNLGSNVKWDNPKLTESYILNSDLQLVEEGDTTTTKEEKTPSAELVNISEEIAYLKLASGEILSGYVGFKNGTDAKGTKLSSAKIRATKWLYQIQDFYNVSPNATEIRASQRLEKFDYEIKISQKHCGQSLIDLLNQLSRCNFSVYPLEDKGVPVPPVSVPPADIEQPFEFEQVEPFDDAAPQYHVVCDGQTMGKVFLSCAKKCWKISGDIKSEFISKEQAAEELLKRSIFPLVKAAEELSNDAAL
jgi:hypothetical protein